MTSRTQGVEIFVVGPTGPPDVITELAEGLTATDGAGAKAEAIDVDPSTFLHG